MSRFDLRSPSDAQRNRISAALSPDERRVLLEHGTEAAFCGVFLDNHKDGIYACRFCGLPLFRSSAKFTRAPVGRVSSGPMMKRTSAVFATRAME